MNRDCPSIESFEELAASSPDDPRRIHLNSCPRCRARMTAFTTFMEIQPLPEGVRIEEARRRLSGAIQREIETPPIARRTSPSRFLWFRFDRPIWKPALGLTALLIVAAVFLRVGGDRGVDTVPVLRDSGTTQAAGAPLRCNRLASGATELCWHSIPSSDAYRVLIYDTNLVEIGRIDAGRDTTIVLSPERLAGLGHSGSAIFWRVAALRNGDEGSLSPPATLRLP